MKEVTLYFDSEEEAQQLKDAIKHKGYIIVPLKHPVHDWRHVSTVKMYPTLAERFTL